MAASLRRADVPPAASITSELERVLGSAATVLAKLQRLSDVAAARPTAGRRGPRAGSKPPHGVKDCAPVAELGVEGSDRRSLYWYYRECMERARGEAEDRERGETQRRKAIEQLLWLANEALRDWRTVQGMPIAFAHYASEADAVEALLTLHKGRDAIAAAAAMRTNLSRDAELRWVEDRRRRAGMKPNDGLPRCEGVEQAKALREQGVSFGAIALRLGVPKTTVQRWVKSVRVAGPAVEGGRSTG